MTTKNMLQLPGVNVRRIRQIQNSLNPIRRSRLDALGFQVGILEAVNGSVFAGGSNYWAALPAGLDADGVGTYGEPFLVRSSGAGIIPTRGHPILIRTAYDGKKEIFSTDAPTFEAAGGNMRVFEANRPEQQLLYLQNVAEFQSRPLTSAENTSTKINVQRLWYMDNYGNINRWKGTDLAADKIDLISYIPDAGKHRVVIVYLRTTDNTIQVAASDTIRDSDDPIVKPDDYQECADKFDAEPIPIQAYYLQNAQTYLTIEALDIDLRPFVTPPQALGFPNPIDKDKIIRSGQEQIVVGDLAVTADLTVAGDLVFLPTDTFVTGSQGIFGDHNNGNYAMFDQGGFLQLNGTAMAWDDLRIPGLTVKLGASAPDLISFLAAGDLEIYGFDGGTTTEQVFFIIQLPHSYLQGSDIEPHIHWSPTTTDAGNVVWQLEYSWANMDGIFPASTTITVTDAASTTAWQHQYADFSAISGTDKNISSMLVCRLFRDPTHASDTYTHDAALLEFDFHYQLDTIGSRTEGAK